VIATQNPLEHEGTYPLPEAELDRFFMKIVLTYPSPEDEKKIWLTSTQKEQKSKSNPIIISPAELIEMRDYLREHILIDAKIYDYVSDILEMTRSRD
jgi:MoxR-like ATPase